MESEKIPKHPVPGGITEVALPANRLEFDELARFAVDEYNKKQNASLQFESVISAKQQIVAGVNYFIALEAKDRDVKNAYEAKVFVQAWRNLKELLDFKLLDPPPSAATA